MFRGGMVFTHVLPTTPRYSSQRSSDSPGPGEAPCWAQGQTEHAQQARAWWPGAPPASCLGRPHFAGQEVGGAGQQALEEEWSPRCFPKPCHGPGSGAGRGSIPAQARLQGLGTCPREASGGACFLAGPQPPRPRGQYGAGGLRQQLVVELNTRVPGVGRLPPSWPVGQ